jgi:hypothetical protein
MAEYVVHDHYDAPDRTGSSNTLIGIILLAVVLFMLFFYGLPMIRNAATPQFNVPSKVDVNLNQK